jgi:hypothetical protein
VELNDELRRIAEVAIRFAEAGEELSGIVPAEPAEGARAYLCAYSADGDRATWLVLDGAGEPVTSLARVRDVVSIAALCELADDVAGGGDLDELRSQLAAVRLTENPPGIDEAEEAALALQAVIGATPRVATPEHLDAVGAATIRLERALGGSGSPFANAMKQAATTVEELTRDVEGGYKVPLSG